jgi:hypothetical protein
VSPEELTVVAKEIAALDLRVQGLRDRTKILEEMLETHRLELVRIRRELGRGSKSEPPPPPSAPLLPLLPQL